MESLAALGPDDVDVLVCGSRGYGPARRVLLGGVSSRLIRRAQLPVTVVPRATPRPRSSRCRTEGPGEDLLGRRLAAHGVGERGAERLRRRGCGRSSRRRRRSPAGTAGSTPSVRRWTTARCRSERLRRRLLVGRQDRDVDVGADGTEPLALLKASWVSGDASTARKSEALRPFADSPRPDEGVDHGDVGPVGAGIGNLRRRSVPSIAPALTSSPKAESLIVSKAHPPSASFLVAASQVSARRLGVGVVQDLPELRERLVDRRASSSRTGPRRSAATRRRRPRPAGCSRTARWW